MLAHNISLINVQSGVALHLMDEKPEQARIALTAINEASADALREVRSVLGVLRGTGAQAPRAPTAGLDRLDDLVTRTTAAGVGVTLEVHGERRPLPASIDLAAFRIVQEALTNIVRHAGAGAANVELTYAPDQLTVQVDDDGHGPGASGGRRRGAAPTARAAATASRACASARRARRHVRRRPPSRRRVPRSRADPGAGQVTAVIRVAAGRRPGAGARRVPRAPGRAGRDRGGRRGGGRARGGRPDARAHARRRADGHPHAEARRNRRHTRDRRGPARSLASGS